MSYKMTNGYGSFYTTSPHEILPPGTMLGMGAADIRQSFNAQQVWADAQLGATIGSALEEYEANDCTTPPATGDTACQAMWAAMGRINAAGARAARAIQAGLNELGYGPIDVDGDWGPQSMGAWRAFAADHPEAGSGNWPTGPGVRKMEELLKGGYHKAGILGRIGLPLVALGILGGLAVMYAKKRK